MRVLAVVVRYKTAIEDSKTIQGYCKAIVANPELAKRYQLLIWDNSPDELLDVDLPVSFLYRHSRSNLGISGACNHAMEYALANGHQWMLLMDQDSTVTAEFLKAMSEYSHTLEARVEIAAVAPTVKMGDIVASPKQRGMFGKTYAYVEGECGIAPGEAFAINSGSLVRTICLRDIGGFNTDFWLDYSDIYIFHQFFLHGKKIWRAADVELEHEMTCFDYDRLLEPWRYRSFSYAETAFFDLYLNWFENAVQHGRLLARAAKQRVKYKRPDFWRITLEQFMYRVRVRRRSRLARWKAEGSARLGIETRLK